jgi:hypothetical protein
MLSRHQQLREQFLRACRENDCTVKESIQAFVEALFTTVIDFAPNAAEAEQMLAAVALCLCDGVPDAYRQRHEAYGSA